MSEPKWMEIARGHLGEAEIAGPKSNPVIAGFYKAVNGANLRDEVPWCAAFVGACLGKAGLPDTDSFMARSYLRYGEKIDTPRLGCIVVFWRGKKSSASGHVAFFLREVGGKIEVLGGNQGDRVSIARYAKSRLLGYRWPTGEAVPEEAGSRAALRTVQERLASPPPKGLGYREVGAIDGIMGSRTRGAILAFRSDNDLSLHEGWTDPEFVNALFITAAPRVIDPARATASNADVRAQGSRTMAGADAVKAASVVGGGATAIGGILGRVKQAGDAASTAAEAGTAFQDVMGVVGSYWWILLLVLFGVGFWYGGKIAWARLEDYRTGKTS